MEIKFYCKFCDKEMAEDFTVTCAHEECRREHNAESIVEEIEEINGPDYLEEAYPEGIIDDMVWCDICERKRLSAQNN